MLKRLLLVTVATLFFALQWGMENAFALNIKESIRTVKLNEEQMIVLTNEQVKHGQELFTSECSKCHASGRTKPNPNVGLGLEDLKGAEPPRDNVLSMADYLEYPTSYDGEDDLSILHPNTKRADLYPGMRNYTQQDLQDVSGYILIQPALRGSSWGGGKFLN